MVLRAESIIYVLVGLVGFLAVTVADVIVVTITWIKTFRQVREASRLQAEDSAHVSRVVFRDGERLLFVYFPGLGTDSGASHTGSLYFLYVQAHLCRTISDADAERSCF